MPKITLKQGDTIAALSELAYHQPQGFQQDNTWYATEEVIAADADQQLECGPATLIHDGKEYPVTVTVMEFEEVPGEDGEPEEDEPACMIEMNYTDGLPKLAYALGLLEGYNKKQLAALGVVV
ncbi:MAG: hypothetical protein IAE94_01755 [Chthoniobacterales bacterium]|nr:hypothetical protein [Chthoniobacterales bacterium]